MMLRNALKRTANHFHRRRFAMNLKPRFLLLTALLVITSAIAGWFASRQLAEGIVEQWAVLYAEKQVLYDKSRLLQPIVREIALSRQFVSSKAILDWARNPDNPVLARLALAEMENFRPNFADQSYFIALLASGRYYHNNAKDEFAGRQYRYTLSPDKPQDRWFYDIVRQRRDIHINVNPDFNLGVTKLWIDVLLRNGDKILGVAGTGLDLTPLLQAVLEQTRPGMASLFVDHNGAIQAHRDQRLIDFASISKSATEHKTLDLLFDRPRDREAIHAAMKELADTNSKVHTRFVEINGKRHLAGVAYLPEIDWYEITLLDLDVLLPLSSFSGILLVYLLTLLAALALFNLVLGKQILRPLNELERAMRDVERGQFTGQLKAGEDHEISRLTEYFQRMAQAQWETRQGLESMVKERTDALYQLAKTDPLTELLNRRGMSERLAADISRCRRTHGHIGLLWLDVDLFKTINDQHGHATGDAALKAVADAIRSLLRPYDSVARWGGDEYLVLTGPNSPQDLDALGERIRGTIAESTLLRDATGAPLPLTVSIGGYFAECDEDMEDMLSRADNALYAAKDAGRNCYRAYKAPQPAPPSATAY